MLLILGIGNVLMRDEGAGVHALSCLRSAFSSHRDICFMDGGTLSFTLNEAIEAASEWIVIDAAELQSPAGTVKVFEGAAMDDFVCASRKRSVHEVGLMDLMTMTRLSECLPEKRALVGIQFSELGWGEQPSAQVAAGFPRVVEAVGRLIRGWRT